METSDCFTHLDFTLVVFFVEYSLEMGFLFLLVLCNQSINVSIILDKISIINKICKQNWSKTPDFFLNFSKSKIVVDSGTLKTGKMWYEFSTLPD